MTSEPLDAVAHHQILGFLRGTLAGLLGVEPGQIRAATRVFELPGIDSLKALQAVLATEKRYGITLDASRMLLTLTVAELAALVAATVEEQRR
ncbi:acyl carrier protein [Streptomyces sp. NPDC092296]|uniref:acyl carrier protein n=1 Tax=Streptomyces sp. NPDC092296 TaxID=3366012 RepID=UPI0038144A77